MQPVGAGPEEGSALQSDPAGPGLVGWPVGRPLGQHGQNLEVRSSHLRPEEGRGAGTGSMRLSSQQLAGRTPGFCRPRGVAGVGTGPCLSAVEARPRPRPSLLPVSVLGHSGPHTVHMAPRHSGSRPLSPFDPAFQKLRIREALPSRNSTD